MQGLVIKSTGSSYLVHIADNETLSCHIKGNFRTREIRSTNPVAVGDYVEIERQADGTNWITDVEDRRNYIIRRSTNLSKESHILAANLDQACLIVTIAHPTTSLTFIDRFLATAEAYDVPTILIFNKTDLLAKEEAEHLSAVRSLYERLGYQTIAISAKYSTPTEMSKIRTLLDGKVTLLSGNSGVGKSTLLNSLFGREMTRTGHISDAHDKGMHTTTFSEMYSIGNGWIIDTPGIKGFGSIDMQKEEVSHYFREIFRTGLNCRYTNCSHTGEPDCAVMEAVENGDISLSRYESYISLLGDCTESKYR